MRLRGCLLLLLLVLGSDPLWAREAVVQVPLEPVYRYADPGSEQVTQVLMWDRVQVVETRGSWSSVLVSEQYRTPEGYPGWVRTSALSFEDSAAALPVVAASYPRVSVFAQPELKARVLERVYMGTRMPLLEGRDIEAEGEVWHTVKLPGRKAPGFVRARQFQKEDVLAVNGGHRLVECGQQLKGVRYLWGGMSSQGIDCSGFVYVLYRMRGITLPRDADQQFEVGDPVSPQDLLPGDLVFFGGKPGDITHVGMYAGKGVFIHASSSYGVATSPLFEGYYKNRLQGSRRILTRAGGEPRVLIPLSRN